MSPSCQGSYGNTQGRSSCGSKRLPGHPARAIRKERKSKQGSHVRPQGSSLGKHLCQPGSTLWCFLHLLKQRHQLETSSNVWASWGRLSRSNPNTVCSLNRSSGLPIFSYPTAACDAPKEALEHALSNMVKFKTNFSFEAVSFLSHSFPQDHQPLTGSNGRTIEQKGS